MEINKLLLKAINAEDPREFASAADQVMVLYDKVKNDENLSEEVVLEYAKANRGLIWHIKQLILDEKDEFLEALWDNSLYVNTEILMDEVLGLMEYLTEKGYNDREDVGHVVEKVLSHVYHLASDVLECTGEGPELHNNGKIFNSRQLTTITRSMEKLQDILDYTIFSSHNVQRLASQADRQINAREAGQIIAEKFKGNSAQKRAANPDNRFAGSLDLYKKIVGLMWVRDNYYSKKTDSEIIEATEEAIKMHLEKKDLYRNYKQWERRSENKKLIQEWTSSYTEEDKSGYRELLKKLLKLA